jgi:ATP-dependent RNA helicase DDX46/PRP5
LFKELAIPHAFNCVFFVIFRQVEVLARKVLTKPLEIQIGGRSVVNSDITQTVEVRPDSERFLRLLELLGEWYEKGKILVFVHSQEKCDSLFKDLLKAGYPCLSLHGAKDQTDRESTIMDFKSNVCNLMIATSVAARGLDVKELELVVNYDVPNHYEDYVHRVGRTGRAGRKGCAVTFISVEEERYAPDLVKALELSSQPVPDDLKKLADDFLTKVKQGSEQAHGSGYGGSGFKFNEEEDEARKAVKKAQAREYGFEEEEDKSDSDSEDDGIRKAGGEMSQAAAIQAAALAAAAKAGLASGPAINPAAAFAGANPQLQAALASMAQVATANQVLPGGAGLPGIGFPGIGGMPGFPGIGMGMVPNMAQMMATMGMTGLPNMGGMPNINMQQFANHMALANMAGAMGHLGSPVLNLGGVPATAAISDGNAAAARATAMAAAMNLQHSLAKIQGDAAPESYEAELEINDFPQHARWKVTHKDALGQISEWTGAAITTRGQYFPAGKVPSPGERKLFLFIEGPTEASVKKAKAEIKRILEESTSSAISLPGPTQPGKYSVL